MEEDGEIQVVRTSELPFEQLPNLPPPVIPQIDLGITRVDVLALVPTLSDEKKTGVFCSDQCTQTASSEIASLKNVTDLLTSTLQDVGQLQKDLNLAHHVLRADYEKRIERRSLQLYQICQEKVKELERRHHEKVDTVRRSHKTQLVDAISKISGEYKAYYDDIMGGKTGKQEARIRELKHKLSVLEAKLEMNEAETERLKEEMQKEAEKEDTPDLPPTISLEEALELRETIQQLELELDTAQQEAAEKDDAIRKITRKYESICSQLEEEKTKLAQTKHFFEEFKVKAQLEKEKAARLAQSRQDALESEWKEKMHGAEQDALRKATQEAELQRMRDQASFQQELERRKAMEDQLREESMRTTASPPAAGDGELAEIVEKLKKENSTQKEELDRLQLEYDRMVQLYETKLEIMQRNFHAVRDESFVRKKLENRSGLLHHSTIGYSASLSPYKKPLAPPHPRVGKPDVEGQFHNPDVKGKVQIQMGHQGHSEFHTKETPQRPGSRRLVHLKDHTPTDHGHLKTRS